MKNTIKLKTILRIVGVTAIAAVIGFSFIACGDDADGDDNGGGAGGGGITIGDWIWYCWNDSGENGKSTIEMDNNNDKEAIHVSGNITKDVIHDDGWEFGYAGLTAEPNEEMLANLRKATSISFKVKGDNEEKEWVLRLRQEDIKDYSYYEIYFTAGNAETNITINISELERPDWADDKSIAFDLSKLEAIQWQNAFEKGPFDLTIRDLELQFPSVDSYKDLEPPIAPNPNRPTGLRAGGTITIGIPSPLSSAGPATFSVNTADASIAKINSSTNTTCTIQGLGIGTARITVTVGGQSAIVLVSVSPNDDSYTLPSGSIKTLGEYTSWDNGSANRPGDLPSNYTSYYAEPTTQLAWYWKNNTTYTGIDFLAYYVDPTNSNMRGWVRTTFNFGGWRYDLNGARGTMNNGVQTNGNVKLELTPEFVYDKGVPYLQIKHKLTNTGSSKVTNQKFGASADIMLFKNDRAPLTYLNYGALMTDAAVSPSIKFRLVCQNVQGVDNVSTLWMGTYGNELSNIYVDKRENITGVDSAMNFSYQNITLEAGQSKTFVVRFTQIQ